MNLYTESQGNRSIVSLKMLFLSFFLLITQLGISQNQKVTITGTNVTLRSAFDQIEKQTQMSVDYEQFSLDHNKKVSGSLPSGKLADVLTILLVEANCEFTIKDMHILITPKIKIKKVRSITGAVTDKNGEPIIGASILVKGTKLGTITDIHGNFSISASNQSYLLISYIGYITKEIQVDTQKTISIILEENSKELEEVVVVGFGAQKKMNLTGSVSSVNSKVLESRPVQNVGQALQGIIPGLNLQTSGLGGELNNPLSFNIRGAGTIGAGSTSSPLVLIDGMEGDFNALNPQDIDNITVLKDAAAASIYGSRAPFGVILVTTKTGKAGKAKVNYNNNLRWSSPLNMPTMMDSHTFALYFNEAAANDGQSPVFSDEVMDRIIKFQKGEINYGTVTAPNSKYYQSFAGSNANTDWFKEQYKSEAFSQEHNISISGGSNDIQYYASGNFLDQNGLSRHGGDNLQRYTLTAKLNAKLSEHVKFNLISKFIREDYDKATQQTDLFYHNIARRWPTVPAKDPNGNYMDWSEIAQLLQGGRTNNQTDNNYTQGQLVITPMKGWNIYAEGNFHTTNYNLHSEVLPAYAYTSDGTPFALSVNWSPAGYSSVYEYNSKNNFFTSNIYTDYEFNVNNNHYFKILAGFNSELDKFRSLAASRSGLITPLLPTISTATDNSKAEEGQYQHWSTAGFFGRLNYNYKERYLIEVNARYDGTSRFIDDKRWNLFPSLSAGWNIAKEHFWLENDFVSMLKLRGSYGVLGNQNTSNMYPFYPQMPIGINNGSWLINGQQPNTAWAPGLISSLLTWEKVRSWNLGIDLGMLKNRLNINFDYFTRMTTGMVGPAPELPVTLGTKVPMINNADMKSYGFELEAKWQDKIGKFTYGIRAVVSDDQQVITNYPNKTGNIYTWYAGQKMGAIWGYTTIGIAKTQAEMDAHLATTSQTNLGSNWGAGDIMYADINDDKKIDGGSGLLGSTGDLKIIGNSSPRYRYSLDLTGEWKGFDFRIFFQGVGKRDYMPNGPYFWGATGGIWQATGLTTNMDYFRDENSIMVKAGVAGVNTDSYFPKPYFDTYKNQQTQTRYIQNAAYLRLKNFQIGYTIPQNITSKIGISKARFYVSGENLLTFTKLDKSFDPETIGLSGWSDGKTYPLMQVKSCGVSINF
jgi:TonB-linked SusC/RagA family outer membrane protein